MTRKTALTAALLAAATLVAGCSGGSRPADPQESAVGVIGVARQAAAEIRTIGRKPEPAAPENPEAVAARALSANPAPLILVQVEGLGTAQQPLAMVGENRGMRTYMTPAQQAIILRGGMLVGTKGLGNDLSVAEINQVAPLIRARRAGQAPRVMRYISGDGVERPLPVTCTVSTGARQDFSFAGRGWSALQVVEACQGSGVSFQNNYLVTGDGQIPVSRQYIGPALGHVTIQTIRP